MRRKPINKNLKNLPDKHQKERLSPPRGTCKSIPQNYKNLERFFTKSLNGIAIHEMIFDETGKPFDYRFLDVNKAFEKLTGLKRKDIIGRTVREVLTVVEDYWIMAYGNVVLTGKPTHFENYNRDLKKYFEVNAFKLEENQFACIFIDITKKVKASNMIAEEESFLQAVFNAVQDGISVLDTDLNIVKVNPSLENMYKKLAPICGKKCYAVYQQRVSACPWCPSVKAMKTGKKQAAVVPFPAAEDPQTWLDITACPMKSPNGKTSGVVEIVRDVTEQKNADDKIRRQNIFLKTIIDSLPYPFYVVNVKDYSLAIANKEACSNPSCEGLTCHSLTHHRETPCSGKEHICPMIEVLRTKQPIVVEHIHFNRSGQERVVEVHGYPIFDELGNVVQLIEYSIDITHRKMMEEQLHEMSITDELTGLLNRRGFMTMATERLKLAVRQKLSNQLLLYTDLDSMKYINDNLGHDIGDLALKEVAAVLRDTFRHSDIYGRLGGDEFAVLLTVEAENIDNIAIITSRLEKTIEKNNRQEGRYYNLSMSTGLAQFDGKPSTTLEDLISKADRLMYECKLRKKSRN